MNFAHFSDTHLLLKKPEANDTFNASLLVDHGADLRAAIQTAVHHAQKPDVLFFTGDLVHEGTAEDYRLFKEILETSCEGTPYFVALGNHDRRAAFFEGFLGEQGKGGPYVASAELEGLRIITLDTSPVDGNEVGDMTEEQLGFLSRMLKQPAPKGTVVLLHHPPQGNVLESFSHLCPVREEFHEIVKNSDVVAVLSGHTHSVSVNTRDHVLYATASSTAFSMESTDGELRFVDTCSYNLGRITENGVLVGVETVGYAHKTLYTMTVEQMAKLLDHSK